MRLRLSIGVGVAALLLLSFTAASAQVVQVSGKVTLKQADGTVVPLAGAQIDIYRTDIKQTFQTTTDKRGAYSCAVMTFAGRYTIAVSAPGAQPDYRTGIRLIRQTVHDFELEPGDGSRLTVDQITARATAEAAEFYKKRKEFEAEIAALNKTVSSA